MFQHEQSSTDHRSFNTVRADIARRCLAEAEEPAFEGYWIDIALRILLPGVLGMAFFVKDVATTFGAKRIYFLARDGLIIKRAYELLFPKDRTHYLLGSRRAFNLAAIEELSSDALDFLTSNSDNLTVAQVLDRLDLPWAEIAATVERAFPNPSVVVSPASQPRLRDMLEHLAGPILSRAAAERRVVLRYLHEQNLFAAAALLVDLGWHASLQNAIAALGCAEMRRPPMLAGVYMGTFQTRASAVKGEPLAVHGWLFDRHKPSLPAKIVGQSVEIFELLFAAPEAGTRCFADVDGQIRALSEPREDATRLRVAAIMHRVVMTAIPILAPLLSRYDAGLLKSVFLANAYALALQPDRIDVARFQTVRHNEHFGVQRYKPIVQRMSEAAAPAEVARAFADACWPEGFLRGLTPHQQTTLLSTLPPDARRDRDRRAANLAVDAMAFAYIDPQMPLEPEPRLCL